MAQKSLSIIFREYNLLYILVAICYLFLFVTAIIELLEETEKYGKPTWRPITLIVAYILLMILYFLLSFASHY